MTANVVALFPAAPVEIEPAPAEAIGYRAHARTAATKRAYKADQADWGRWCAQAGEQPCPATPEAVGRYLEALIARPMAVATLTRRVTSIAALHRAAGLRLDTGHPALRETLQGIRRVHGVAPKRAKPATTQIIRAMIATCACTMLDDRDRALLLIGYAGAFRRSELVALTMHDVEFVAEGVKLTVTRSKADQEGQGAVIGVHATGSSVCPVGALRTWLKAASITKGAVFRSVDRHGRVGSSLSDKAVAIAVQRRARLAGIDQAGFSGHSLRAGLATSAAAEGYQALDIARQTRHRSLAMVATYVRLGSVFQRNLTNGIGL